MANKNRSRLIVCSAAGLLVISLIYGAIANPEKRLTIIGWLAAISLLLIRFILKVRQPKQHLEDEGTVKILLRDLSRNYSWLAKWILFTALIVFCGWLVYDAGFPSMRYRSFLGILIIYGCGICLSMNPNKINWRPVLGGFTLQLTLAFLFLRWSTGYHAFNWLSEATIQFLDFTFNGTDYAYGFVSNPPNICGMNAVFVFKQLQILIYFGAIVAVLQYFGIIQAVLSTIASFMRLALNTTSAESLNVAACVFLGTTEASLLIEPLISTMTESEIHMIMTVGFACISGSLFAIYIGFGACPVHLLSATVMSAAVSISVSKMMYPAEKSLSQRKVEFPKRTEKSVVECISNGASHTIRYVWAIAANLLVYMSLLSLLNSAVEFSGSLVGLEGLSFNKLVGYLFFPITYIIGVSDAEDPNVAFDETLKVAELLGVKTTINEFIAFLQLSEMIRKGQLNGKRARMMTTFLLCGFTNIPMIGAQIGLFSAMCPAQNATFAKLAVRSFISALMACLITACVAGMIMHDPLMCESTQHHDCIDVGYLQSAWERISRNNTAF